MAREKIKPQIYKLKDEKSPPDEYFQYTSELRQQRTPIVIDNGSFQIRVGWATDSEPRLVFRNLIARTRREKGKKEIIGEVQVGNEIANVEAVRFQLKTPFDRNVVTQFEAMEQILDYIFSRLGIDTEGRVNHPIVLTEPLININFSRQLMTELLFDTYNIPGVCYGVDCLLSYRLKHGLKSGIILGLGYHVSHVIPILEGSPVWEHCRRLNIGGFHAVGLLHRLLQLKYPAHANAVTLSRSEEILHEHSYVAPDYLEELKKWSDPQFYEINVHVIQLAYVAPTQPPTANPELQKERRRELQKRLFDVNARKRDEKLKAEEELLGQYLEVQSFLETGQMKSLKRALAALNIPDVATLSRKISTSQQKIEAIQEKIKAAIQNFENPEEIKPVNPQPTVKRDKEEQEAWVGQLHEQRTELLARRAARRQRKRDLAQRRTAAAQERMRIISQLAKKEKKEDNFGMRDEDWDVYKAINKDCGSSDSEEEMERLNTLETELRANDPTFDSANSLSLAPGESHQLHLSTERIRAPEVFFQPSLVGSHEAGLSETLEFVLKRFTPDEQLELVSNIFVTGGSAMLPGMVARLNHDLLEMRPFQSCFHVEVAASPSTSAFYGAQKLARSVDFAKTLFTKEEYKIHGSDMFKMHESSNVYHPTPKALPTMAKDQV